MRTLASIVVSIAIILFFSNFAIGKNKRHALVIGNSEYKSAPLRNPVNDAVDISKKLKQFGFEVKLLTNADLKQIERAIRIFGKTLQDGGTGLFYFAGHGIQVKGRNYLVPIGAILESEGDAKYEAVDAGLVLAKMEDAQNDLNIVILDACRNNPFTRSFRSSVSGLARMDAPTGSLIAYATAPGSVAADGNGRNGVYTKYLLEHMDKPGLTIEQVLKKVRIKVLSETQRKQVPWESSSLTGDFYFSQSTATYPDNPPKTTQETNQSVIASLQSTPKINNAALQAKIEELYYEKAKYNHIQGALSYLSRFPNGRYTNKIKGKTYYVVKKQIAKFDNNPYQYDYVYDTMGNELSVVITRDSGSVNFNTTYDDKGIKISRTTKDVSSSNNSSSKTTYDYDDKGLLIRENETTTSNSTARIKKGYKATTTDKKTHYTYNEYEQLIEKRSSDGTVFKWVYNKEGKAIEYNATFGERSQYKSVYRYNSLGQQIEILTTSNYNGTSKQSKKDRQYASNGMISKETTYNDTGTIESETTYNQNGLREKELRYDKSSKIKSERLYIYEPIILN